MLELLLSIFFSTTIVALFKVYSRYDINLFQTIVINYATCFCCGLLLEPSLMTELDVWNSSAFPYLILLAFFFIGGFTAIGLTVRHFGLSISALFQKLPFLLSALFGIVYYGEQLGVTKGLGLSLGLAAVFLSYKSSDSKDTEEHRWWHWMLPILTFVGGAVIEIIFLVIKREGLWSGSDLSLTSIIFGSAGILGVLIMSAQSPQQGWPSRKELLAGICLGIPNFFSIYFLLALLNQEWDGSVIFPVNNIGILVFSGLLGVFYFREKMSLKNSLGLLFALAGIVLILIAASS